MDKGLNVKEKAILKYIEKEINKKGYAPTIREICEETGIKSTASVYNYMVSLKKKGYIEYDTKRCRTLKILKENEDKLSELETNKKAVDNLLVKNAELKQELETYKKIAEKLAEEMVLHGICSGVEESDKCYANEIQCNKCIIDWARKEVENDV